MKHALLWLLPACTLMGQTNNPVADDKAPGDKAEEMEYDFAEVHRWDDVMVKLDEVTDPKLIEWFPTNVASHKGVIGKSQNFSFRMDFKVYQEALRHPDSNRGVIFMSGDPRFPLLHCWLRPFSIRRETAVFDVDVPVDRLKEMYIAFIPNAGKKRYLYNLADVALHLKNKPEPKSE